MFAIEDYVSPGQIEKLLRGVGGYFSYKKDRQPRRL
jgi:hypothetical protein